jgi:hypothetical protein
MKPWIIMAVSTAVIVALTYHVRSSQPFNQGATYKIVSLCADYLTWRNSTKRINPGLEDFCR